MVPGGAGNGLIITLYCPVVTEQDPADSVTFTHPDGTGPHVTEMELPVFGPLIVPPDIVHE